MFPKRVTQTINQSGETTDLVNFYREGRSGQDWESATARVRERSSDPLGQTPKSITLGSSVTYCPPPTATPGNEVHLERLGKLTFLIGNDERNKEGALHHLQGHTSSAGI